MLRAQAELVARGETAMFVHNFDALVTKDYLDTRFREFETRFERIDSRFSRIYLMFGIITVAVTIPVLQKFFA